MISIELGSFDIHVLVDNDKEYKATKRLMDPTTTISITNGIKGMANLMLTREKKDYKDFSYEEASAGLAVVLDQLADKANELAKKRDEIFPDLNQQLKESLEAEVKYQEFKDKKEENNKMKRFDPDPEKRKIAVDNKMKRLCHEQYLKSRGEESQLWQKIFNKL